MIKQLKTLQTIYFAIAAGGALFAGIAVYNVNKIGFTPLLDPTQTLIYKMILVFAILAGVPTVISFTQKGINRIESIETVDTKLAHYTKPFLTRLLVLDTLAFISILFYMQSGDYSMGLIAAAVFIVMLLSFPSVTKVAKELKVEEEALLNN